jgi:hypothetical protein
MPRKNNLNASITERVVVCDVTEQEAFDCYRRIEDPTPAAVVQHFTQLDRKLSRSTIEKWAHEGEWQSRIIYANSHYRS